MRVARVCWEAARGKEPFMSYSASPLGIQHSDLVVGEKITVWNTLERWESSTSLRSVKNERRKKSLKELSPISKKKGVPLASSTR